MGKGRAPCCEKIGLKKGSWTPAEDLRLMAYIRKHGHGNWRALPKKAGLLRCGKSCRLRWINYLRPDIKRGNFTKEEEDAIIELHQLLGNKWSKIASRLPGRTDNEIKNVWNTHLKKRLNRKDPPPSPPSSGSCSSLCDDMIIIQRDVDHSGGVEPNSNSNAVNNISHMNSIVKEDSSEDGVIEISVLSNVEMWDILEQEDHDSPPNCNPNDSSNNNDMDLWGMQIDKHYAPHQPLTGTSSSPTSSNSGITNCTTQMLEDGKRMFSSQVGSVGATTVEESAAAAAPLGVEDNTWIEYLERELDLWCANDRSNHQSLTDDFVEPTQTSCEDQVDFDPITSYFQSLPGSLIPF